MQAQLKMRVGVFLINFIQLQSSFINVPVIGYRNKIQSFPNILINMQQAAEEKAVMELPETLAGLNTDKQLVDNEDNLAIFISNIVVYCREVQGKEIDPEVRAELRDKLKEQFNVMLFDDHIQKFSQSLKIDSRSAEVLPFEKQLYELEIVIRQLMELKNNASSEEKYVAYENEANHYLASLNNIISQQNMQKAILESTLLQQSVSELEKVGTSEIDIPSSHYFKELVNTAINYSPAVFSSVRPLSHQFYVTEAARTYHDITPFKIKTIAPSLTEGPQINRPNFFEEGLDEAKAILHYCVPLTKKVAFYSMADVCRIATVNSEYYHERTLSNDWSFSPETRSVIIPSGKIFAINCRSNKQKADPYFYEIGDAKASNRGPLPAGRRDAALLYMAGFIYLIGGKGDGERCSKKNYRYSIRDKKWSQLAESNVALRKPTVCALNGRYICKLGGLNEFDYINKIIEMYDSVTDKWALVRASPRNILEQIQILEDSLALQISDDQFYVFGGKNANKFSTDSGFVLVINEIREKKKGAPKVAGQFWNVSVGKRNILTFFGEFSATSPLIQHNCIYGLRTSVSQASSI